MVEQYISYDMCMDLYFEWCSYIKGSVDACILFTGMIGGCLADTDTYDCISANE